RQSGDQATPRCDSIAIARSDRAQRLLRCQNRVYGAVAEHSFISIQGNIPGRILFRPDETSIESRIEDKTSVRGVPLYPRVCEPVAGVMFTDDKTDIRRPDKLHRLIHRQRLAFAITGLARHDLGWRLPFSRVAIVQSAYSAHPLSDNC